jgi:hypothetical protein
MKLRAFDVCVRAVQRGYTLEEIRPCLLHNLGDGIYEVDVEHAAYPKTLKDGYSPPQSLRSAAMALAVTLGAVDIPQSLPSGPGTELKALLKDWLGIESTPTCSCNAMARKMDSLGPEWCKSDEGMAEILGVMRDEHAKRWADGRTILPWSDIAARQLVLLACRRAAG